VRRSFLDLRDRCAAGRLFPIEASSEFFRERCAEWARSGVRDAKSPRGGFGCGGFAHSAGKESWMFDFVCGGESSRRSQTIRTAFWLVKRTQSNSFRRPSALSSGAKSSGGRIWITGRRMGWRRHAAAL